jgi:predicted DNA-binding transcriptional regulator AlpA
MLKIISVAQLEDMVPYKRTTIWRLRRSDPTFPPAIRLSTRRIGFDLAEVEAWIDRHRTGQAQPPASPSTPATASAQPVAVN